jgi:parallel beta-helix repeat protein
MKETAMCGHWVRLAVVVLAAAYWAGVSCGYVFGEGLGAGSAKVLHVASQGADYKSIQAAVDAAGPGVEIIVASGTYTESIWIAKAGLTLRSANKHGAKIMAPQKKDAFGLGEGANNITLDGFDITAPGGNGVQTNRTGTRHVFNHHTIVRNCYVHDCGCGGIQLNHGDYRTVEYNIVHHCASTGPWGQSGISFWQAIALDREPGFHIIVRGNILWNNSNPPKGTDGNGLIIDDFRNTQYGSTNGAYPNKTLVENNVAYHNGARGIHVFLSDHVVVRNNTVYHNNWDSTNNATWRGELSCVKSSDVKWYNNIAVASSALNGNNTAMMDGGGNQGTEWAGNLLLDSDKPATPSVKISGGADRKVVLANNLVGSDPRFVAPGTGVGADFRLKAGSPAIGAARAADAPTKDLLGRKRDKKPDIGAYEFGAKEEPAVSEIGGPKKE